MKNRTKLFLVLVVIGGLLQFVGPETPASIAAKDIAGVPQDVNGIIRRACFDCHSPETNLRWYDKLTPANFLVASHIRKGRAVLNFGAWDSLTKPQRNATLYYSVNKILSGEMPLKEYNLVHPGAKLTDSEVQLLKGYLLTVSQRKLTDSIQIATADSQYSQWIKGELAKKEVRQSPNGIAYIPEYRNWKSISTTDRFDNGTMRIIFGNDIAVKAIQSRQTNPWPDGSVFAKTAWNQQVNKDSSISTGQFLQVEFMIKDAKKYKDSEGWGWARWKGEDLKPYGETIKFDRECISCHRPMKNNDYVFTRPLDLSDFLHRSNLNDQASVSGSDELTENPLLLIPLTSSIKPGDSVMSTLYGNEMAAKHARTVGGTHYPAGAVLYEVTWKQQPDSVWFGANIPREIVAVERVAFNTETQPEYNIYKGRPLKEVISNNADLRILQISSQHIAVSP